MFAKIPRKNFLFRKFLTQLGNSSTIWITKLTYGQDEENS